jgi:hypothetical protein
MKERNTTNDGKRRVLKFGVKETAASWGPKPCTELTIAEVIHLPLA